MVIKPYAPKIDFNLTNSVKEINFPKNLKTDTEKQDYCEKLFCDNTSILIFAIKKKKKLDTQYLLSYLLGKVYGPSEKYEEEQINRIIDKLSSWEKLPESTQKSILAWSEFFVSEKGEMILREGPLWGFQPNIPDLIDNTLSIPDLKFDKENPYYVDFIKLYKYIENKKLMKKDMAKQ
ncbi:MAG: hypothetical protein PHQ62_02480 [Clostridia bacterium]|nr:hypothetical protein [Clostridia bacterium]